MKPKYRIRVEKSDNYTNYYPEVRGLIWGWNNLYLHVDRHVDRVVTGYKHYDSNHMSLIDAKRCIDYAIGEDNMREEIIDYP